MKKLKEKLNAKLSKNSGFTLVEMLIVVAIIAILVAVSIPIVNNSLERARHATDAANERAAKAEILIRYLAADVADASPITVGKAYYYDAQNGTIVEDGSGIKPYGRHKIGSNDHTIQVVVVQVGKDTSDTSGNVYIDWAAPGTDADELTANGASLCGMAKDVKHSTT